MTLFAKVLILVLVAVAATTPAVASDVYQVVLRSTHLPATSPIVIGTAGALDCCSKYNSFGRFLKQTYELYIDWVNEQGGLLVNGTRRPVEIRMGNDESDAGLVTSIFQEHAKNGINLWLGTYSSGLSLRAAQEANASGALLMCHTGSSTSITRGRPNVYNTNPPAKNYLGGSFEALVANGAKTIGSFYEAAGAPTAVCSYLPELADTHGMTLMSHKEIPFSANMSVVRDLVADLKTSGPDVVFACVYEDVCHRFIEETLVQEFEPKAVIFTVCVTSSKIETLGEKGRWVTGVTSWLPSMPHSSAVTGWTAEEFAALYVQKYNEVPPYQAAAAWAATVALGVAVERANSTDTNEVSAQLRMMDLETLYGRITFDSEGQTLMEFKAVQRIHATGDPVTVSPLDGAVEPMHYPMPSIAERGCLSPTESSFGYTEQGACVTCPSGYFSVWNAGEGQRRCLFCPAGSSFDLDSGLCSDCPPGTVSISAGQLKCTKCTAGTIAAAPGQSQCTVCPVGTFSSMDGLTQCQACQHGDFNNEVQQTMCRKCIAGTISFEEGAIQCKACPEGKYAKEAGMSSCGQCAAGFVTAAAGADSDGSCICPKSSFLNGDACNACPPLQTTEGLVASSPDACFLTDEGVWLIVIAVVVSVVVPALVLAIFARFRQRLKAAQEENARVLENKVQQGVATIREFGHPMVLISADKLVGLTWSQLRTLHEGVRDMGVLTVLDSVSKIKQFRKKNPTMKIALLSYQWLSWVSKGPNRVQFQAMRNAVAHYADKMEISLSETFVWLDILSVPQCHKGVQQLAINSLYTYASAVDALIIVAPDSVHEGTKEKADLETYKSRVWTRMEQIAHIAAHSIDSMYIAKDTGLEVATEQWIRDVVYLFDGDMTCCRLKHRGGDVCDKESLVLPLLGLWFLLSGGAGETTNGGAKLLKNIIQDQTKAIFPRTFTFHTETGPQQRVLFGDLIHRLEDLLAGAGPRKTEALSTLEEDDVNGTNEEDAEPMPELDVGFGSI